MLLGLDLLHVIKGLLDPTRVDQSPRTLKGPLMMIEFFMPGFQYYCNKSYSWTQNHQTKQKYSCVIVKKNIVKISNNTVTFSGTH